MKKNILKIFIGLFVFLISINVKAAIDCNCAGGGSTPGTVSGSCSSGYPANHYCYYGDTSSTVKLQIWYIDASTSPITKIKISEPMYWTSSRTIANAYAGVEYKDILAGLTTHKDIRNKLEDYFSENNMGEAVKLFAEFGVSSDNEELLYESEDSCETGNCPEAVKGYRIIMEPVFNTVKYNNRDYKLFTAKELLKLWYDGDYSYSNSPVTYTGPTGAIKRFSDIASSFDIEYNDVGIKKTTCSPIFYNSTDLKNYLLDASDEWTGCGYNIIDITWASNPRKCYTKKTKTTNKEFVCINNDQNNYETYTETYEEISCDKATEEEETNTENGKLIHKTSNCKIYCIESAVASFPGNVTETTLVRKDIFGGTYFMWPTKEKNSIYSMHMTSKYTCTIVTESGKTCSQTDINTLTKAARTKVRKLEHSVSLTAGNNLPLDNEKLAIASTETNKNEKEGSKYVFEKTTYFKIPDNKNRYINKSNGNILNYAGENCFDRGEGTISLRSDTDISKQYELKLTNLKLGVFTEKLPKNYSCNYSIKKISCDCPPYTLREGETLDEEVAKNPDMSCAELQEAYCGKVACVDDKGVQHDITLCVQDQEKKGLSYKEAYDKCGDEKCYPNDKYYCLKNNGDIYLKNNKPVELKTCMDEYVKQGMSKEYAYNACFEEKCNICYTREGKTADIEDCMKLYKNYNICESLYCPNTPCPGGKCINYCKDVKADKCKWSITSKKDTKITLGYKCDDSDKGINEFCNWVNIQCPGGNEKMEKPENCVSGKLGYKNFAEVIKALNSGKITASDVSNAFTKCESTVCPGTKKLNKIIYRTIDLKDPFPGKKGNSRKPGYNWNSKIRIEREILKGRGTNDYDIYKKEPLMVITLDSKAIKQIKEYNKNNEYSDFKLIQVQNASKKVSGYYTSIFIRETIKENVKYSDDCKDISTIEKFNKCYNNDN